MQYSKRVLFYLANFKYFILIKGYYLYTKNILKKYCSAFITSNKLSRLLYNYGFQASCNKNIVFQKFFFSIQKIVHKNFWQHH